MRARINIEQIAVSEMFKTKAVRISPIVKNLTAKNMLANTPTYVRNRLA